MFINDGRAITESQKPTDKKVLVVASEVQLASEDVELHDQGGWDQVLDTAEMAQKQRSSDARTVMLTQGEYVCGVTALFWRIDGNSLLTLKGFSTT